MKQHFIAKLLLILCPLLAPYAAFSFSSYGNMEPVTMKSGLNNNTIYDICYGNNNFVWIATDMGISRYDGFRVRNFPLTSPSDENLQTYISEAVVSIHKGIGNLLYLQLLEGGLACFDPDKEAYIPVSYDKPMNKQDILSVYVVDGKTIYIGTTSGLYAGAVMRDESKDTDGITIHLSEEPLVKGTVSVLSGKGKEFVFAGVDRTKVVAYNVSESKVEFPERKEGKKITALYQHDNYLWVCTAASDIELYDLKRKTFHRIVGTGEDRKRLSHASVTDIVCIDAVNYYVATWDGLFSLGFDSEDLGSANCYVDFIEPSTTSRVEKRITTLKWNDEQRILWIGTFGGGSLKMYCTEQTFHSLHQNFSADISGIEEDQKGYVWILTDKGELWRSASNQLSVKTPFELWTKGMKPGEVYHLDKDVHGRLWLGDIHGGVICINPLTEEVITYKPVIEGVNGFPGTIRQFCLDSRDRLWLVTTSGLILFDYKANESKLVGMDYEGQKIKDIYSIAEDKEGTIWLGTNVGVKRLEMQGDAISLLGRYEKDAGLEVSPVYSIYVNSYNQILASYSDKLIRIDGREKEKVENVFTLLNGLCSSHIFCMVDDANGNTWVGSNSGIMTIRNDRTLLYNYASFGYSNKVCRLRDGRLLWASSLGLTFFDPMTVKVKKNDNNLRLSEVWVNGELVSIGQRRNGQVILKTSPDLQRKFVFGAGNDDFTLYFSDLEYGIMQRKQAYRLLPDEEWKIGALEDGVTYRHLPTGNYTLQTKLIYSDASESEVVEIPIRVKTYWWNTIWARIGYLIVALGLLYAIYYYIESKRRRREMHMAREMELKEKLNLSRMKQEQEQEIDMMRDQLLTKFVEELRTPLSLIIAPLKEMSRETNLPSTLLPKLQVAYRNALGMLDACNQLLAIYTQGALSDKLKVAPCTAERLIDQVIFSISELVRINQIDFKCEKRIKKDLELWIDNKRIRFVLHNLLSNAFNHVRFSGIVHLSLQEVTREGVRYCVITVEDNGKNRVKEVPQLMDDRMLSDLTNVELGYNVMEQILKLHHGTIAMKSLEGEGTEVVVELPVNKELLEDDPNIIFVDPEQPEEQEVISSPVGEPMQVVPMPEETIERNKPEVLPAQVEKKTLLIVEDHKDIRLYLKVLFDKEYNLLLATNGQEGVDLANKEQPDLILCDVMMPVKDGFECCRELKEGLETCHIPFIMLTAKVEDDDIIHGLELGADDYILKPFTPSILKAKVRNLINGRLNLKKMYTNLLVMPGDDVTETAEPGEEVKMEDPFISSVVKIIEENICEADFNVKKLASELNMSQPTLYRKVKQSTDFTIIELIRGVRMRKAAVLLKQKIYAVQDVAEMVGYNDIPTFRKHFVDTFGTTPSTYPNAENS